MHFTKTRADAFQTLQMNAGILVDSFDPDTRAVGNILGATTGGITFATNPTYVDFGEDVDNVPANTKQLKMLQYVDPVASGTFVSMDASLAASLAGGGSNSSGHITPPNAGLVSSDAFSDLWLIGDYSQYNEQGQGVGAGTAGFVAIHIKDALNTTGFAWTTQKDGKGQFAFEYHGHYDLTDISVQPYEIYIMAGTSGSATPSILLNTHAVTIEDEDTYQLIASTDPVGQTVSWSTASGTIATVSGGLVTAKQSGNTIITASITVGGITYSDTCTVVVPS